MPEEEEDPNAKAEREARELQLRLLVAKKVPDDEFNEMLNKEKWTEDKIAMLKSRAAECFKQNKLDRAVNLYTRAIGMHAIKGSEASHALYGNRSACRCGVGDYDGALADAEECIRLSPAWGKGYARKGAALYGLYRFDDAVKTYELGLTHEPSLAALTDGLNDALRRRKAMGGRWTISDAPPDADPLLAPFSLMRLSIGNGSRTAHGDTLVAVADSDNCRVGIHTKDGDLLRNIGERASKFLAAPRVGHFVHPPGHVALADGHLFVLESNGATNIHVFDPEMGEPKGLLQPPYNSWKGKGCLTDMCVDDDALYVSTTHGGKPRILRLPRKPTEDVATADENSSKEKDELAYKKGFLLDIS